MHEDIYFVFCNMINTYIRCREEYTDPLLNDMFVYSHWDCSYTNVKDTLPRELIMQSYYDGWLSLREHAPSGYVDLMELSEKGIKYITTRMEFDAL